MAYAAAWLRTAHAYEGSSVMLPVTFFGRVYVLTVVMADEAEMSWRWCEGGVKVSCPALGGSRPGYEIWSHSRAFSGGNVRTVHAVTESGQKCFPLGLCSRHRPGRFAHEIRPWRRRGRHARLAGHGCRARYAGPEKHAVTAPAPASQPQHTIVRRCPDTPGSAAR